MDIRRGFIKFFSGGPGIGFIYRTRGISTQIRMHSVIGYDLCENTFFAGVDRHFF
jgi:hypothetical protein